MKKQMYLNELAILLDQYDTKQYFEILADIENQINNYESNKEDYLTILGSPNELLNVLVDQYQLEIKVNHKPKTVETYRSNALWNTILVTYHVLQVILSFIVVILISLCFYFGFDSRSSIYNYNENNQRIHLIEFCGNNQCNKYQLNLNKNADVNEKLDQLISFSNGFNLNLSKCNNSKDCLTPSTYTSTFKIHYGYISVLTSIFLILVIRVLYIFIYRNVMCNIIANNEFNRRFTNE